MLTSSQPAGLGTLLFLITLRRLVHGIFCLVQAVEEKIAGGQDKIVEYMHCPIGLPRSVCMFTLCRDYLLI